MLGMLQSGFRAVSTSPQSWSSEVLLASPPQQPGPTSPTPSSPSSWSLTHRRACPALPSTCSGCAITLSSLVLSLPRDGRLTGAYL